MYKSGENESAWHGDAYVWTKEGIDRLRNGVCRDIQDKTDEKQLLQRKREEVMMEM